MIRFLVNKIAGPVLVYAVLALFVSNAVTGYLLKQAYDANIRANLECNNSKLEEALQATEAVRAALEVAEQERERERNQRIIAEAEADRQIAEQVADMEDQHAAELDELRLTLSSIPDDDYECASEPVSSNVIGWMRKRAEDHNQDRGRRGGSRSAVASPAKPPD